MAVLWPFCPSETFIESLQWVSDVITSYAGEQRIRLTSSPRQTLNISHTMTHRQYERAKLLFQSAAGGDWNIPLWHERQRITVSSGVTTITVDTTTSDYRAGGYAILWTSDEDYELVEIDTVADASLTITSATTGSYAAGFICPVRTAYCPDGMDVSRSAQPIVNVSCEWLIVDDTDLADASLYPTYRTYPVITDAPRVGGGSFSERIVREVDQVDNGLSVPFYDTMLDRLSRSVAVGWMPYAMADLWAIRGFLHYLKGKQKAFWVPDWTNGVSLVSAVSSVDTTITILAIGLNAVAEAGDIMIKTVDGTMHRFQYTSVTAVGANEVLNLSAAAGVDIALADIDRVCFLRLCRLAQDRIELEHRHRGPVNQISSIMALCEEVPIP